MSDTTDAILADRAKVYGDYATNSALVQSLKDVMRDAPGWQRLLPYQRESLEMIALKIGRALNGNANIEDHWADIAGYARLSSIFLRLIHYAFPLAALPSFLRTYSFS